MSEHTLRWTMAFCVASAGLTACAQAPAAKMKESRGAAYYEQFKHAQEAENAEKFADAAALYEGLTQAYPDDVEVWIRLGSTRSKAKQFRAAAEAFSKALAGGGEYPGSLTYRVARLYALAGDKAQALAWLERALAVPMENRPQIAGDDAFAAWREDDGFRKLAGLAPKRSMSREEAWNSDLDFLLAEIRRLHYAYRGKPLPRGFEEDVRLLRQRMPRLTDSAMEPEIQRLLARLGDGHTGLQGGPGRQIPLQFYDFEDGMFVVSAPEDCGCVGERVSAIGGTAIADAVRLITPFLSVDNAMGVRARAPLYLRMPEYLHSAGIVASESQVVVSLEGPRGKHQYTAKPANDYMTGSRLFPSQLASAGPVPRYLQNVRENYWFEVLPDGKTVYFQFNQVLDQSGEPIEKFAVRLRAALSPAKISNLIVDLRNNGGGNLNLFTPLLRSIIAFETTHEGAGVYALTSRQTFSAAQVFVNELDHYTSAVVAGEPSGSRPNFIGESAATRLPNSGFAMTISTRYHQTDDQDQRMWIAPKIPVALTSADYFANRDPVLDAVLQVIGDRKR